MVWNIVVPYEILLQQENSSGDQTVQHKCLKIKDLLLSICLCLFQ